MHTIGPRSAALAVFALMLAAPAAGALASTDRHAAARGRDVAEEADRRDLGFENYQVDLSMILRNRHGEESTRRLRYYVLEVHDDGDRSLTVFDAPGDVKGTIFLSHTHATGPDDQWLYLPSLKRVKRIASNNKSGPFMGSEFAYEDITSPEVDKYAYEYVGEEVLHGAKTHVVKRHPTDPRSGYTQQVVWYDAERFVPLQIEFYDRKGELLKTLGYHGYRKYHGQYWRADRLEMTNQQTGKSTTLLFEGYRFKTDLNPRDFDQASLTRTR